MAGRGAKTPTKNSSNIPLHTPPVKHEKIPQLPCYQTYVSRVPAFATFFFQVPPCWREVPVM